MANPTVCMSSPCFRSFLRFFWIRPTTKLQPTSPSSGSSSSSSSLITNWGFIQNVSAGEKQFPATSGTPPHTGSIRHPKICSKCATGTPYWTFTGEEKTLPIFTLGLIGWGQPWSMLGCSLLIYIFLTLKKVYAPFITNSLPPETFQSVKQVCCSVRSSSTYRGGSCSLQRWILSSRCRRTCWRSSVWPSRLWWCRGLEYTPRCGSNDARTHCRTSCRDRTGRSSYSAATNTNITKTTVRTLWPLTWLINTICIDSSMWCKYFRDLPELSVLCVGIWTVSLHVVPLRWSVWTY